MLTISDHYVDQLPQIYKDILSSFFMFNPQQRLGERVAVQSLYSVLRDKNYTLAQIRVACEKMQEAGVAEITDKIFVQPTDLGKQLIQQLQTPDSATAAVPDFPPIEAAHREG
jgi:glycosyltransferase A (GT-A) superfamily protein (DUF2064 family)